MKEPVKLPISSLNLNDIQALIRATDYKCEMVELDSTQHLMIGPAPFKVGLESFDSERLIFLDLSFVNDSLKAAGLPENRFSDTLFFYVRLPFKTSENHIASVGYLASLVNMILPLGQFGVDDRHNVYFRYALKVYERELSGFVLIELVEMMMFFVQHLGFHLESVAIGQLKVEEALKQVELTLGSIGKH